MSSPEGHSDLLMMTTEIVAAHVSNNNTNTADLPALIHSVYGALSNLGGTGKVLGERPQPAVPIKKSVQPDFIICLEDGKQLKMLKRHLMSHYNMTPEQYRERWGLPSDYPMTAPNYATQRSKLAKKIGLGSKPRTKKAPKKKVA